MKGSGSSWWRSSASVRPSQQEPLDFDSWQSHRRYHVLLTRVTNNSPESPHDDTTMSCRITWVTGLSVPAHSDTREMEISCWTSVWLTASTDGNIYTVLLQMNYSHLWLLLKSGLHCKITHAQQILVNTVLIVHIPYFFLYLISLMCSTILILIH